MPHASLAEFLEELARQDQLARVAVEVDPGAELAEIAHALLRQSGPAALFDKLKDRRLPLATNLLASRERICLALEAPSLDEMAERLAEPATNTTAGWMDALRRLPGGGNGHRFEPRLIKNAPSQQVVRLGSDVDLRELPLPRGEEPIGGSRWHAIVMAQSYDRGERTSEVCRLLVADRNRLSLGWRASGGTRRLALDYQRRGRNMPLAVVLGGHPLDWIAALAPQPLAGDPWLLAGDLRGRALEIAKLRTLDLDGPADAELILEGTLDTRQLVAEDAADIEITAVTHRANAVLVAMLAGEPPHELSVLTAAVQRIFLPQLKRLAPELTDVAFPSFGGGSVAVVAMQKAYAGQARKVASLLWGLDAWLDVRLLVLVDDGVDLHDELLTSRLLASAELDRDLFAHHGPASVVASSLADVAGGVATETRWGLDATRPLPNEGPRKRPDGNAADPAMVELVRQRWRYYGLPPRK